ncbi:unnamed protein product [Vitrella brassicaformis CCMP3155]|uniref:Ion transport domain-containing protein n=3 Tax=Vitrella brassicaformis TaxID=1169539 RepID=A0A0G4EPJ9_VITBC|nr:unnamed protein product [Vitrella brassicaformis CCMP3155]|eukprot:CEL99364.1 unnamed protein product [Vitrella brassicaformis CCMP3155]
MPPRGRLQRPAKKRTPLVHTLTIDKNRRSTVGSKRSTHTSVPADFGSARNLRWLVESGRGAKGRHSTRQLGPEAPLWVDVVFGALVVVNSILIGAETDLNRDRRADVSSAPVWYAVESTFLAAFWLEAIIRLAWGRKGYFRDAWNMFDLVLVSLSSVHTWVVTPMALNVQQNALSWIVVLRALRLLRIARILRVLRFTKELWLLLRGFTGSLRTVFWTCLLGVIVIYTFAIVLTEFVYDFNALERNPELFDHWGTVLRSMFSLFVLMTLEWSEMACDLMQELPWVWVILLVYLAISSFAILNLVVGVICESTLSGVSLYKRKSVPVRRPSSLCSRRDCENCPDSWTLTYDDGWLTKEELRNGLKSKLVVKRLRNLAEGMDPVQLLSILNAEFDQRLSSPEFVNSIVRMLSEAKSMGLLLLLTHSRAIKLRILHIEKSIGKFAEHVTRDLLPHFEMPIGFFEDTWRENKRASHRHSTTRASRQPREGRRSARQSVQGERAAMPGPLQKKRKTKKPRKRHFAQRTATPKAAQPRDESPPQAEFLPWTLRRVRSDDVFVASFEQPVTSADEQRKEEKHDPHGKMRAFGRASLPDVPTFGLQKSLFETQGGPAATVTPLRALHRPPALDDSSISVSVSSQSRSLTVMTPQLGNGGQMLVREGKTDSRRSIPSTPTPHPEMPMSPTALSMVTIPRFQSATSHRAVSRRERDRDGSAGGSRRGSWIRWGMGEDGSEGSGRRGPFSLMGFFHLMMRRRDSASSEGRSLYRGSSRATTTDKSTDKSYVQWKSMRRPELALRIAFSPKFDLFFGLLILLNAIVIGLETDYNPHNGGDQWGWYIGEMLFNVNFIIEFVIRFSVYSWYYFHDLSNTFDFLLVLIGALDAFVLTWAVDADALRFFGVLRVVRLLRLARVIRLFKIFKELWLLLAGLKTAMRTLLWLSIMLVLILYFAAVFLTIFVGKEDSYDDEIEDRDELWGTIPRSMFTLFGIMTLDEWPRIARDIIHLQPWLSPFFPLYIMVTSFGIMNVVIGVICENCLSLVKEQNEQLADNESERQLRLREALQLLFSRLDEDSDGLVTYADLIHCKDDLATLDLIKLSDSTFRELQELFRIMTGQERDDRENETITVHEFTSAFLRMKDHSLSSLDLLTLLGGSRDVKAIMSKVERKLERLAKCLSLYPTFREALKGEISALATRERHEKELFLSSQLSSDQPAYFIIHDDENAPMGGFFPAPHTHAPPAAADDDLPTTPQ